MGRRGTDTINLLQGNALDMERAAPQVKLKRRNGKNSQVLREEEKEKKKE